VNAPIFRLFAVFALMFAVLIGFSSRWAVFGAQRLRDNGHNSRVVLEEQRIKRGVIRADDGAVLAGSTALSGGRYARRYPTGTLFAQPVGFDNVQLGRTGLEKQYNDQLVGRKDELTGIVDSLVKKDVVGDNLQTTLDPKGQKEAFASLQGHKGAVVALDVKTGAVRVLAGTPSFDPNDPGKKGGTIFNNATQGLYPPGSTFKTVTASAAIDSGRYQPESRVSGKNGKVISGTPLNNFGGENFGDITLTDALTHSVNTVWAEVGVKLGRKRMQEYMDRFGFGQRPPMDYPAGQLVSSGSRDPKSGALLPMSSGRVDVGRTAIGQGLLLVTPLQMASVAQTIGNGGLRMEPRLVEKVIDPDGRTVETPLPKEAERVLSADSAAKVGTMMKSVVREGSGTAAALQGVELAGKTGTAEIDINQGINDLWFIGFTGKVAVAVIIEREKGQGGTVAAPIAKRVLQALGQ
jgi:peptidoglycan glycosyltransferase